MDVNTGFGNVYSSLSALRRNTMFSLAGREKTSEAIFVKMTQIHAHIQRKFWFKSCQTRQRKSPSESKNVALSTVALAKHAFP